jgi:uncharacterized membrane protein YfcA
MAGGFILLAVFLYVLPVGAAMVLHGGLQLVANGARALFHYHFIVWRTVLFYSFGLLAAFLLFMILRIEVEKPTLYISIGLITFAILNAPSSLKLDAQKTKHAFLSGVLIGGLQLFIGAAGSLLDSFYVRTAMTRHQIVSTKAACMVLSHIAKIIYFGTLLGGLADLKAIVPLWFIITLIPLSLIGTYLSKPVLNRFSDQDFKRMTGWLVGAIGFYYLCHGLWLYFI